MVKYKYLRLTQQQYDNWLIMTYCTLIISSRRPNSRARPQPFISWDTQSQIMIIWGSFAHEPPPCALPPIRWAFFVLNSVETFPIYGDSLLGLLTPITPLISNKIGNLGTYIEGSCRGGPIKERHDDIFLWVLSVLYTRSHFLPSIRHARIILSVISKQMIFEKYINFFTGWKKAVLKCFTHIKTT
jgi:hypothetical protein